MNVTMKADESVKTELVEIRSRWWPNKVIFSCEVDAGLGTQGLKLGAAVKCAIRSDTFLNNADLRGVDLGGADLNRAEFMHSDLSGANLSFADLSGADLMDAVLKNANLKRTRLSCADLSRANLEGADLEAADLWAAYLPGANLAHTELWNTELLEAELPGANLTGANVESAKLARTTLTKAMIDPLSSARMSIVPEAGEYVGWVGGEGGVVIKILVPAEARRSNAAGRVCRAEFATVLEVIGGDVGVTEGPPIIEYRVGETVRGGRWDDDRWNEDGGGVPHYITRIEAGR